MTNQTVVPAAMEALGWLQLLGLGGLAGAVGQGARTIVGIKKTNDAASTTNTNVTELIIMQRIFISLAIGFVAGALGGIWIIHDPSRISTEQILALMAAGYVGTDFIEGLISRIPGTTQAGAGQEAIGVGGAASSSDDAVG